jgi:ketosteroid isomerase-like protein
MQLNSLFVGAIAGMMGLSWAPWSSAAPTIRDEVLALGQRVMDAANAGDMERVGAEMAAGDPEIIDNFPPFSWGGRDGYSSWLNSYGAELAANKIADTHTALGDPIYVRVDGDVAYVAVRDTYTYKRAGTPVQEDLIWTYVARKTPSGWKIASFSFSGGPKP